MEKDYLDLLQNLKAFRKNRLELAKLILSDPSFMDFCFLSLNTNTDASLQTRAAWVLDLALEEKPELFLNRIDEILRTQNHKIPHGALRSLMRMLSHLCQYEKKEAFEIFSNQQRQDLVTYAFDALIGIELVAVKVHAMEILYHQSHRFDWLGPALKEELSLRIENQSAAYQSRAKKILSKLT